MKGFESCSEDITEDNNKKVSSMIEDLLLPKTKYFLCVKYRSLFFELLHTTEHLLMSKDQFDRQSGRQTDRQTCPGLGLLVPLKGSITANH